jgi:hypothetical protein
VPFSIDVYVVPFNTNCGVTTLPLA